MGRAYTEEERESIRQKLMEEGLALFHEGGNKSLSIRELTGRVGISMGCFYNFYPTKEDFVKDVVSYRSSQKMKLILDKLSNELENPIGAMTETIYEYMLDMSVKIREKQMYRDMIGIVVNSKQPTGYDRLFAGSFKTLEQEWKKKGLSMNIDLDGLWSMISMLCIMIAGQDKLETKYFNELMYEFISAGVNKYITEE